MSKFKIGDIVKLDYSKLTAQFLERFKGLVGIIDSEESNSISPEQTTIYALIDGSRYWFYLDELVLVSSNELTKALYGGTKCSKKEI